MKIMTHDPSEYIRGLQALLVSDKKKIGFLFGAGTSLAKKDKIKSKNIPAISKMTSDIETELFKTDNYKTAIDEIKNEIGKDKYTIETLLSAIEQKKMAVGRHSINGLNFSEFDDLCKEIKKEIHKIVSIHKNIENELEYVIHVDFADWIERADRYYPIEIFTTNYDYLFELGLEYKNVPYYDGFTGSLKPFFNSHSVDDLNFLPKQTKLWKIHGSLGWHYDEDTKRVWRKDSDSEDILIYPSTLKYNDSKKQPYTALGDRLTNFLKQSDTILIISGYSFGDEHINERILTALKTNTSAHVFVLFYDAIYDSIGKKIGYILEKEDCTLKDIAKANNKISVLGCRHAIIGCQYGKWKLKREPDNDDAIHIDLYFDQDAHADASDMINNKIEEQKWTGEGELKLPDFTSFVNFLQSMIHLSDLTKEGK
ncbi:MAG: hypothetical protein BGP01_05380 [Paludibacter sp. 47-17]|nr:MAG: hypothetical protein BGP01_05380 [Paludibacter sp. 47-17]